MTNPITSAMRMRYTAISLCILVEAKERMSLHSLLYLPSHSVEYESVRDLLVNEVHDAFESERFDVDMMDQVTLVVHERKDSGKGFHYLILSTLSRSLR